MNIESWCQVESSSKERWTRTQRRHDENALKSPVFDARSESIPEGTSKPKETELDKLARRKNFKQKCMVHMKYSFNLTYCFSRLQMRRHCNDEGLVDEQKERTNC